MTAPSPSYANDMERVDRAEEAVRAVVEDHFAHLHNPVDYSSFTRRNETIALLLVISRPDQPGARAWWASTDGDPANVKTFPKSIIDIRYSECDRKFVLALMRGYVAIERHLVQRPIPRLCDSVNWTAAEREGWKNLRSRLPRIRDDLRNDALGRPRKRFHYAISRRGTA